MKKLGRDNERSSAILFPARIEYFRIPNGPILKGFESESKILKTY